MKVPQIICGSQTHSMPTYTHTYAHAFGQRYILPCGTALPLYPVTSHYCPKSHLYTFYWVFLVQPLRSSFS